MSSSSEPVEVFLGSKISSRRARPLDPIFLLKTEGGRLMGPAGRPKYFADAETGAEVSVDKVQLPVLSVKLFSVVPSLASSQNSSEMDEDAAEGGLLTFVTVDGRTVDVPADGRNLVVKARRLADVLTTEKDIDCRSMAYRATGDNAAIDVFVAFVKLHDGDDAIVYMTRDNRQCARGHDNIDLQVLAVTKNSPGRYPGTVYSPSTHVVTDLAMSIDATSRPSSWTMEAADSSVCYPGEPGFPDPRAATILSSGARIIVRAGLVPV